MNDWDRITHRNVKHSNAKNRSNAVKYFPCGSEPLRFINTATAERICQPIPGWVPHPINHSLPMKHIPVLKGRQSPHSSLPICSSYQHRVEVSRQKSEVNQGLLDEMSKQKWPVSKNAVHTHGSDSHNNSNDNDSGNDNCRDNEPQRRNSADQDDRFAAGMSSPWRCMRKSDWWRVLPANGMGNNGARQAPTDRHGAGWRDSGHDKTPRLHCPCVVQPTGSPEAPGARRATHRQAQSRDALKTQCHGQTGVWMGEGGGWCRCGGVRVHAPRPAPALVDSADHCARDM